MNGIEQLEDEQCRLTKREFEVVSLLVFNGYSNQELAEYLCISEKTVKNHVANIFRKMNINSIRKLMSICMSNLLTIEEIGGSTAESRKAQLKIALEKTIQAS
ncbi:transcriptional regulator, LuxR family [Paenibacillus curdlanolyticus YK9]|uniref:Transcriptional regulator, LuxR family n=1 Tax=Paenibacillus curdlanolyticus YK9 TaxID=717606 RepID=E0IF72_9BACL|nr:LuxR C-terminal-related transcriptional regulator [Paenibacillus curdlanolyticus]EFM08848.1 transcriptional regulator, LuxR family [Paenibacillus curdlanolyticus YK9]